MENNILPDRRTTRLRDYDYRSPAAYFVTICTHERECSLGQVVDGEVVPSAYGRIAGACWCRLPSLFAFVELDAHVIMPNHLHGIVVLPGDTCRVEAPADRLAARQSSIGAGASPASLARGTIPGSLAAVIQSFKSVSTRRVNALNERDRAPGRVLWQQGYYEHVVRNDRSLEEIRDYITSNPFDWQRDEYNPSKG